MYEKDGEKYFVMDSHTHFWDASPANWVPGAEEYAEGWINCFHAYQGLGPAETHWSIEDFQKYSPERFEKDMFEDGHVVADVMRAHDNVKVEELPSMIRIDGTGQFDFSFEEIAEALGWADFGNDDFEEIMSTHYGRMVVEDDRVIMFANPEDAAEYIDFDLKPVS